jgi:hypothetical protein
MKRHGLILAASLLAGLTLSAQQTSYTGTNITGQFVLTRTTNPMLGANRILGASNMLGLDATRGDGMRGETAPAPDVLEAMPKLLRRLRPDSTPTADSLKAALAAGGPRLALGLPNVTGLPINLNSGAFGFDGVTHNEQRNANNGNQFNVEPPNPSIAVANGYVLLGVNNAIQVYNLTGTPLLPRVLSSNELFGVAAAIDRTTGANGVYPTDMRVFHDQSIDRWFVLQRAQDYDTFGNTVASSHLYMAVSQTSNPTGIYNIYVMDTTDAANPGCPCVADYPILGADQHGFYISSNEYNSFSETFVNAQIHAVSKASLLAGSVHPVTYRIRLPFTTGHEFAIHPAITPPGASYFVASGGVQYFVATQSRSTTDNKIAVFALSNTSSLATVNPQMTLVQIILTSLTYTSPDVATQRPGPLPYGGSFGGVLSFIDGGDPRLQSATYVGGRIYTTLAVALNDETGKEVVGGAFLIISPTFRNGILAASIIRQGQFAVRNNNLLRSAIAVNAQGRGAIAATLVGPDHFPSSVFLPIDTFSGPSSVQLAKAGSAPQDGFTGYTNGFGPGLARWGDYATPFVSADGSVWMAVQYIPNLPRSVVANWGVYISKY